MRYIATIACFMLAVEILSAAAGHQFDRSTEHPALLASFGGYWLLNAIIIAVRGAP